jgi:predicted acylesterase/phospholipase RssA
MNYQALCLSGGKLKFYAHLGALTFLYPHLKNLKCFIGTSIGSVVCLLIIIGYHPLDIYMRVRDIDLSRIINPFHMLRTYGMCEKKMSDIIKPLLLEKLNIDHIPTLKELYKLTGKFFVLTTYNIDNNELIYISHLTYPNLNCLDAIEMSVNIPPLFGEIKINDERVIDAGLINNFPIEYFKGKKILGVNLLSEKSKDKDLMDYFLDILDSTSHYIEKNEKGKDFIYKKHNGMTIINVRVKDPGLINISDEKKINLFTEGFFQSLQQYEKKDVTFSKNNNLKTHLSKKLDSTFESSEFNFLFYMIENHPQIVKKKMLKNSKSTILANNMLKLFENDNETLDVKMSMDFLKKNNSFLSQFKKKWHL